MTTLYRKYRPKNFKEIVNQNHIKVTLEHEIETGKIAHAYLFCGPRAVGKTTVAGVLAKSLNCEKRKDGTFEPCGKCDICGEIDISRSLDVIEIDAASHTGVDNVRENIIANANVAPSRCNYKVFIIDEVHMLSISAFNALLKIIEEPPENVVFILCTTEVHKVPTTIISRCQRFDFKRISVSDIAKKLKYIVDKEGVEADKSILESVARHSEGHMRDAESLLGQIIAISGKKISNEEADLVIPRSDLSLCVDFLDNLVKKDASAGIALANRLVDEGVNLKEFLADLIEMARKMMLVKINPGLSEKVGLEYGEDMEIKISKMSEQLELKQILEYINTMIEARNSLKDSFISQLPLEMAFARLCSEKGNMPNSVKPRASNQRQETDKPAGDRSMENVDLSGVLSKWNEVLAKVKKYNHSLSFILRVCRPREINGNRLCIAFKYKFHKDRMSEANIKQLVEKVLREVYGAELSVEAIVDENLAVNGGGNGEKEQKGAPDAKGGKGTGKKDNDDSTINDILETLGGKVIE